MEIVPEARTEIGCAARGGSKPSAVCEIAKDLKQYLRKAEDEDPYTPAFP
jgi:hypothetical protein